MEATNPDLSCQSRRLTPDQLRGLFVVRLLPGKALAQTGSDSWEGFPTPFALTARSLNT